MAVRSLSPTEARVVRSLEAEVAVDLTLDGPRRRARISRGFARKAARASREWVERSHPRATDPCGPLGRPSEFGRRGEHDPRWAIVRNVPKGSLDPEVDTG